jgi:hypothetical protein
MPEEFIDFKEQIILIIPPLETGIIFILGKRVW